MVTCRNCGGSSLTRFIDLGSSPPSNNYLDEAGLSRSETWIPLRAQICTDCWLAQTEDFVTSGDVFGEDYAYFSSMSDSWLAHARAYVDEVTARFELGGESLVIEVASNDGYLLQFFQERGVPCLGIEPTASTARAARELGIEVLELFLGGGTAQRIVDDYGRADIVAANNVLAHVPDIADFSNALRALLKDDGVLTVEFPRLTTLIDQGLFDTIYHEHFSYLSLHSVMNVFRAAGLEVFDVAELTTHGGSLRVYAQRVGTGSHPVTGNVQAVLDFEYQRGVLTVGYYQSLQTVADKIKRDLLRFLIAEREAGRQVAAYGAAAKGNTLLNYAGVRPDLLPYVVDRSPGKVGKFLPGSRIPILAVEALDDRRPDVILVLPWNLAEEVERQLAYVSGWGGQLYAAIPILRRLSGEQSTE